MALVKHHYSHKQVNLCEFFWNFFHWKHCEHMHFLFITFLRGGDKRLMCHPFEHLSHKIMVDPPLVCLNNMHGKLHDITSIIESIHPSMTHLQAPWWNQLRVQRWIVKGKGVKACSLVRSISRVEGCVGALKGLRFRLISNSITHMDLQKRNNKLVSA